MKRFSLRIFAVLGFLAAQTMSGCGTSPDTSGNPATQAKMDVLTSPSTPVYNVSIAVEGQSRTIKVRPSDRLNAQVLKVGFKNLHGSEAVQAVLADVAQRTADEGNLVSANLDDEVLIIDATLEQPQTATATSGVDPTSLTATCVRCWDVYSCSRSGCRYIGRVCEFYRC